MEDYGRRTQDILVLSHCGFAENFDDLHGSPDSDINGKSQEKLRSNLRSEIGIFRFQQAESSPQRSPVHLDNGKCVESEYQSNYYHEERWVAEKELSKLSESRRARPS